MLQARSRALALIAGHAPPHVTQTDYEQAKKELRRASREPWPETAADAISDDAFLAANENLRPDSPNEDEDREGHNESARLVEQGMRAAEMDQTGRGARADRTDGRQTGQYR
jgi:hypothetical protein